MVCGWEEFSCGLNFFLDLNDDAIENDKNDIGIASLAGYSFGGGGGGNGTTPGFETAAMYSRNNSKVV